MIEYVFDKDDNRSVAIDGDKLVGESVFSDAGNIWIIDHTIVAEQYEGQGIAKKLVEMVVDEARKAKLKLMATCPYALKLFRSTDIYDDVLLMK